MIEKTHQQLIEENAQLKIDLAIANSAKSERDISDGRYAPMITKTIVFGLVGTVALAVLYAVLAKIGLPH